MSPAAHLTPWYRSLRFRLVAAAIVVEILMLGLLVANSYRLVTEALESQTRARLEALTPLLNASLAGRVFQRDHSEIKAILHQLAGSHGTEINYIKVYDQRGEPLAGIGEYGNATAIDRSVIDALGDLTYDTQIPLTLSGDTQVGTVRFGLSLAGLATLRGNVLEQSLAIAAIEVLLSLLLLVFGGYLLTRHIASLLAGARRVTDGDYGTPIPIGSHDEIGELADNFNTMTATVQNRIVQLAESETRFRAIFDAAGDAFFIHDAETGRTLDVNRRMCEMYGCTHAPALGRSMADVSSNVTPFTAVE
ncbi:MAG: HAMP domain-containing protein, partial [Rhodocyclaceae bacterium]|nr:HAMP domain-containing protein [Rhodocyclaceae bacterium]